jgi:hypothetical protein
MEITTFLKDNLDGTTQTEMVKIDDGFTVTIMTKEHYDELKANEAETI